VLLIRAKLLRIGDTSAAETLEVKSVKGERDANGEKIAIPTKRRSRESGLLDFKECTNSTELDADTRVGERGCMRYFKVAQLGRYVKGCNGMRRQVEGGFQSALGCDVSKSEQLDRGDLH